MHNRPTLPGIASILDFAGQHPTQPPSLSTTTSHSHHHHHHHHHRLQSSDPLAHVLPAFTNIPPFQHLKTLTSPTPYFQPPPTILTQLDHQQEQQPTSNNNNTYPPPPTSKPNSLRNLCHPSHQPVLSRNQTTSSTHHHTLTNPFIQPRHSERIPRQTNSNDYQNEDHRNYPTTHRRESYESLSNHRLSSYEPSPRSPDLLHHPSSSSSSSKLANTSSSSIHHPVSSLGPQHRYQCMEPGCGKTFSRPSSLKIHSYSHTGQKPFKCMRCDRAFSVQSNLKRHQKVHEKRSIARPVSHHPGGPAMVMVFERDSGRMIEEESGDEDHGSEPGTYDRMED